MVRQRKPLPQDRVRTAWHAGRADDRSRGGGATWRPAVSRYVLLLLSRGIVLAQRCGAPDLRRWVILTFDGGRKAAPLAAAAFLAIELGHPLASSFRPI